MIRFTKKDVAHIATFKHDAFLNNAFNSWQEIVAEVRQNRIESDVGRIAQAGDSLMLSFE